MLEFLQENPLLWDIKLTDFRRTDKKNRLWEEQASKLDKTPDFLKGWFRSLRDTFTRIDKRKSGDGAKELTEREQWIKDNFSFLKVVTRHRPEPVFSIKAAASEQLDNLTASEAASEIELDNFDAEASVPSHSRSSIKCRKRVQEDDVLKSIQKRLHQSDDLLKHISQPPPINERTAFANYVRESLLTINKKKLKKVRSAINQILTQVMDEDSDDDTHRVSPYIQTTMPVPVFEPPVSTYYNPSTSTPMYQPAPQMSRNKSPQVPIWTSVTQEFTDAFIQPPLQPLYQNKAAVLQLTEQNSSGSLSSSLRSASHLLNQIPVPQDLGENPIPRTSPNTNAEVPRLPVLNTTTQ